MRLLLRYVNLHLAAVSMFDVDFQCFQVHSIEIVLFSRFDSIEI